MQARHDGAGRESEDLARELLARAATAPDPRPLIEAAETLLEEARAARGVLRLPPREAQA